MEERIVVIKVTLFNDDRNGAAVTWAHGWSKTFGQSVTFVADGARPGDLYSMRLERVEQAPVEVAA